MLCYIRETTTRFVACFIFIISNDMNDMVGKKEKEVLRAFPDYSSFFTFFSEFPRDTLKSTIFSRFSLILKVGLNPQ